jgi:hypothetical protein
MSVASKEYRGSPKASGKREWVAPSLKTAPARDAENGANPNGGADATLYS